MAAGEAALEALLQARHSCRGFRDETVARPTIERLLTLAQRTPSWCNTQPWQVIVTSGAATRRLAEGLSAQAASGVAAQPDIAFPPAYRGVHQERRRVCGFQLYGALGIERGDRAGYTAQARENFRLFGAPHFALVTTEAELGTYGAVDCGGYVSVFLLAAQALGLAAIPQAAVASYSPWLRQHFTLPAERQVLCGIAFGYGDPGHAANGFRTGRAALDQVVQWHDGP